MKKASNDKKGLTHLAEARIRKGLTIADITRLTGISYDNYIKYERGKVGEQYMCLDTLRKLSEVLETDLFTDYHRFKADSARIVREYMERNELSIRSFAKLCGVSVTTVKNWRNGTCAPSVTMWEKFFK